jgi:aryl carrier-like protein
MRAELDMDEIALGGPMHGRRHWQLHGAVGNFVNVVPIVFSLSGASELDQVTERVARELDVAEERMDVPFAAIARAVGSRTPYGTDVVDATFGEQLDLALELDGSAGRPLELATGHTMFGLSASFRAGAEVTGRVEFRQSMIGEQNVDALVAGFFSRLKAGPIAAATVVGTYSPRTPPPDGAAPPTFLPVQTDSAPPQVTSVAAAWREVLGLDHVEVDDDFFELGGDSLRAQMIIARLEEAGLELTIDEFFANSTIGEQQSVVESRRTQVGS